MYATSRNNTDEQSSEGADAAQLIDSFFLPGGLFDPEDATNAAVVGAKNEGMLTTAYDISDLDSLQQSGNHNRSRLNQFQRPSPLDHGDILPHMAPPMSEGSGSHNPTHKFSSSDNSTATPAAGVGALDPNNDQAIVGGGSSRVRQGFDFDRSGQSVGREAISMIPSPQLRSNFDQDIDNGIFQKVPPMSRTPGMPSTIAHSPRFQITPATSNQSYHNTQSNRIEESSADYEWYRQQRPSIPLQTDQIQYSSYAAIQPSNEFSSLYGNTIRSNPSSQNQRISSSTSDIKQATSEHHLNSKLNSNPWSNDDLVTLPTSATNQAKYNYNFNFMPSEDKIPSNNAPTEYVEECSEYSHPMAPFNSKRNDTHRAPPGFIASSSTSQNSQNQTSETTSMRILSSSQMQPLTNSLQGQERRMNYSAVASRNNSVTYHSPISSQKQQQQQEQQQPQQHQRQQHQQHIITSHNESNDLSSYSQRHHQLSSSYRPSKTQSNIPSPMRKKSYTAVQTALQQDVDYDFRSQSSRDVPSTIYVEDDAISNSEDTLTVCADSVTVTSLPQNRSERFDMDVVEETSMTEVSGVYLYSYLFKIYIYVQRKLRFTASYSRWSVQTLW